MAVSLQPQPAVVARPLKAGMHFDERIADDRTIGFPKFHRDPTVVEEKPARIVAKNLRAELQPMREWPQRANVVHACHQAAELFQLRRLVQFGSASADAWIEGKA